MAWTDKARKAALEARRRRVKLASAVAPGNRRVYHGTTMENLRSILKTGLQPRRDKRTPYTAPELYKGARGNAAWVSSAKKVAAEFGLLRATLLSRTTPKTVGIKTAPAKSALGGTFTNFRVPLAVIRFDVPKTVAKKLFHRDGIARKGIRVAGSLSPKYIRSYTVMEYNLKQPSEFHKLKYRAVKK